MSSIVEEVAGIKQEQEAQRGDLVRINNSIKELAEAMQGTTAAINNLSAKYDRLMNDMQKQPASSDEGITQEQIRDIIAGEVKGIQLDGASVFEPLRKTVIKLNHDFEEASERAAWQIANAGKTAWWKYAINSLIASIWFVAITSGILYWGFDLSDMENQLIQLRKKAEVIHYNQTIDGANYNPWEMEKFHEAWMRRNEAIQNAQFNGY